jgi:hypothetical protein
LRAGDGLGILAARQGAFRFGMFARGSGVGGIGVRWDGRVELDRDDGYIVAGRRASGEGAGFDRNGDGVGATGISVEEETFERLSRLGREVGRSIGVCGDHTQPKVTRGLSRVAVRRCPGAL